MGLLSWGFKKKNNNERQSRHFPGKWSEVQTNPKRPSLLAWVYDLVGMVDFTAWPEQKLVGGFNPIPLKTMLVKMGISFPKFSGWKIQKIFELPPPRKPVTSNQGFDHVGSRFRRFFSEGFITLPGTRMKTWNQRCVVAFVPRVEFSAHLALMAQEFLAC